MSDSSSPLPLHPDIKRELQGQLLTMSARSFEFFAGDFLVYLGLEAVSVTRYVGDGGIDAYGDLIAGRFRIPIGIQVKRYRQNVQRPDIDRFIGALSGRFSDGLFMTTASYAPNALQKAVTSTPRVLTLNGEQIVSIMVEHNLGLKSSSFNAQKLAIDPDYFSAFEDMKRLFSRRMQETPSPYTAQTSNPATDEQAINLTPEEDLISLNALGYALRVDPLRVRRWVEHGQLQPNAEQLAGGHTRYYFRRDAIEQIRRNLELNTLPSSSDEWKQEFLDFAQSRNLTKSYKPVMIKTFFALIDRDGRVHIDDLVHAFKSYYIQQAEDGHPLEINNSIMTHPHNVSNQAIKRLIITHPLERFLIKNFIEYAPDNGILRIAPQLWQELRHYELIDVLKNADAQLNYYITRQYKNNKPSSF